MYILYDTVHPFQFHAKMYMYGSVICHSSLKILWMNRDGVIIQMKLLW